MKWISATTFKTCNHNEIILQACSNMKENTSLLPHPCRYGTMETIKWCQPVAKFYAIVADIPRATGFLPQAGMTMWNQC